MAKAPRPGAFTPGNKVGVGNQNAVRGKLVTDVIIAKLNEVDPRDPKRRALVWRFVDELFEHALSREVTVGKGTQKRKEKILGELSAMFHIIDRSDGRPVQGIGFEAGTGGGKVTLVFEPEDGKVL